MEAQFRTLTLTLDICHGVENTAGLQNVGVFRQERRTREDVSENLDVGIS